MAEEPKAPPEPTPLEERAIVLEKIREILPSALIDADEQATLDLDLFTRLLLQRAIPYRTLNREIAFAELNMVREEQNTQRVRAEHLSGDKEGDKARHAIAKARLEVLIRREQQILDQLWPVS